MNNTQNPTTHISLLLLTKDEQENITKNFEWLAKCPGINEIVVVDDNSQDKTIELLKNFETSTRKVKIFSRGLDNNFSLQRQFGVDNTTNDYIFWIDADEQPDDNIIGLLNNIDTNQYNYSFNRQDVFLKRELLHGETAHQSFLRLFNKNFGNFRGLVHETWDSSKPIFQTNFTINHYSHSNLKEFFSKINFYSDIRAKELYTLGKKAKITDLVFYPLGKFIYDYLILLGFLDGTPGIIFALGMSFQSFLSRAKLWHLSQKPSIT